MKQAGMKLDQGANPGGDESGAINMAHADGFKVLLGVLGDQGQRHGSELSG